MHILILNQYYAPDEAATAQIAADLGAHLAKVGHDVTAICCDRSYAKPQRRYPRRETIDGVLVKRVRTTAFGRGSKLGRMTDYLGFLVGAALQLLRGRSPDVVIALTTPPMIAYVPLLFRRFRRYRVIFWSMDVYPDVAFQLGAIRRESLAGRLFARIGHAVLRSSDAVIALGNTMAERLRQLGAERVEVVHNWADESAIVPVTALDRPSRVEWGWTRRFVVLYSGNLGLAHEFETVVASAKKLAATMPNVLFAFIGVGPRLAEAREATRDAANVVFQDYVERARLGDTLAAADVHLVTLRPDMVGLLVPSKIYGILAAGRPTIYVGPPEGEIHDILREGRCGTSVRNGDVDGLIAAVREYACNPIRRDEEGTNARRLFESRFTRAKSLRALQAIVEAT
ncbi:MAG: glycosyltransferase family 4 protein [Thermoanaerobaculia bacterium]